MKAFPHNKHFSEQHTNDFMNGMDLRDYVAATVLPALIHVFADAQIPYRFEYLSGMAYQYADAIMFQRCKK